MLVTVTDITEKVVLAREIEKFAQNDQQFEILTKVINTNPDLLNAYIDNSFKSLTVLIQN